MEGQLCNMFTGSEKFLETHGQALALRTIATVKNNVLSLIFYLQHILILCQLCAAIANNHGRLYITKLVSNIRDPVCHRNKEQRAAAMSKSLSSSLICLGTFITSSNTPSNNKKKSSSTPDNPPSDTDMPLAAISNASA